MRYHGGARQWRVVCDECGESTPGGKRMHSQVSRSNLTYFVEEGRVDLSTAELRERHSETDGALLVCNNCGTIREAKTD